MYPKQAVQQEAEAAQKQAGQPTPPVQDVKPTEATPKPEVVVPEGYKRIKFGFKEQKVDGKKTGVRRATVELNIPVPTDAEVLAAFAAPLPSEQELKMLEEVEKEKDSDKKKAMQETLSASPAIQALRVRQYVMDLVEDSVYGAAREQVNANENISQDALDEQKLSLSFLANMPKAERRGAGISKETWDDFKADYIEVMTKETNKPLDKVTLAAELFVNRLQKVKTLKPVLKALKNELAIWFQKTNNREEFAEVYEFLDEKADTFITADESDLLKKLGAI